MILVIASLDYKAISKMYIQHSVSSVLLGQSGFPLQKCLVGLQTSAVPGQSFVPEKQARI
jgi:hypothetical protein